LAVTSITGDRSRVSPLDALYLDAINATVTRRFGDAIKFYDEIVKLTPESSPVYVDLGYAYENDGNLDKALENYLKAIELNKGQYATAFLRAGIVYQRKGDTEKATARFDQAERLYQAASNNEGLNEVYRQRGILFRNNGLYDEAKKQFEQSLNAARSLGNEAQQITSLIGLSYLHSSRGLYAEAENYAQQAVTIAQQKNLENLAANGLLEVGNSYSTKGDLPKAEQYWTQAIQLARVNKGRLTEHRGLTNLGGLYIQTLRIDEGLRMVQQAFAYFQQENYPRIAGQCLTQIGRAYRRKGEYAAAQDALNKKLENAQQSNSQPALADAYLEFGALRLDEEKYPAALEQYDNALKIYETIRNNFRIAFCKANRAKILARLGQFEEAKRLLDELFASESKYLQLIPELHLVRAEMSLSQGDLAQATASANEAIKTGGEKSDVAIQAQFLLGVVKASSGGGKEAQKLCNEAINAASNAGDFGLHSRALLAGAEAALKGNDAQTALTLATQAQARFARGEQLESEWRAWIFASRASQQLNDTVKAAEQLKTAQNTRYKLEQQWSPDVFRQYAARPDIQAYYR
ncbi:MAG TPA: tetratricopeptide repeat protein, partial [Pyrinomonadaceae bacterium]|nr:tetratricopeptide repeat protein [Pyrinomonadaceae bacterium]